MRRRPGLLRRASIAYISFLERNVDRLISLFTGKAPPPPLIVAPPPPPPVRLPVCFSATRDRIPSLPRQLWHHLGYGHQDTQRLIFWVAPGDDVSAWRVLDDRRFGGRTEARVRIAERKDEEGKTVRSIVYEGHLHPLSPFAPQGSRWKEDIIRPPFNPSSNPSSPQSPSAVGPTGLSTPPGLINGFSSLTSPAWAFPDLNLLPFSHLAVTFRTDGRPYLFFLRCKEGYPILYQARVPADPRLLSTSASSPSLPPFTTKTVRFEHFIGTFQGQMRNVQLTLPKGRIAQFGLSVNGPPGPFRIEVEKVEARRGLTAWEREKMSKEQLDWELEMEKRGGEAGGADVKRKKTLWWLTDEEQARLDAVRNRGKKGREKREDETMVYPDMESRNEQISAIEEQVKKEQEQQSSAQQSRH